MSDPRVMDHRIKPEYVPLFKRYQCRMCHRWINYSEEDGHWHHQGEQ